MGWHLVREEEHFLLYHFWSEFTHDLKLALVLLSALWCGGVDSEVQLLVLVGVGERIEKPVSLTVVVLVLQHVTTMAAPGWLRNLIVEETRGGTLSELLKSEPLENVWLLTVTSELHGGNLSVHIMHHVLPGLLGVEVKFPAAVSVLSPSPVWHGETLVDGPGSSVEGDITDALEEGVGVEILGVHVHKHVGLLVEFH